MNANQQQEIQTLLRRLTTAAATASLYSLDHRQVDFLCCQALTHFNDALEEGEELSLLLIEQDLICNNRPLEVDMAVSRLIEVMRQRGLGHLKLRRGLSQAELLGLVELLTKKGAVTSEVNSTEHVRWGRVEVKSEVQEARNPTLAELETMEQASFTELYRDVRCGKRPDIRGLKEIVGGFLQVFAEQGETLLALAPLRALDEYSYTHSTNVCILNLAQARLLGIKGQQLYDIGLAAMLHDVGKLFIPQEVLQKPGKLDDREWQLIQAHPRLGAEYLANTPGVPRLAVITAYEHHMRYDSTGYPKVGKNWQQHLCSQMTTIADFFDALRTHRSYRAAMDFEKVSAIMLEEAGAALHPLLVKQFLKTLSELEQSTTQAAIVPAKAD